MLPPSASTAISRGALAAVASISLGAASVGGAAADQRRPLVVSTVTAMASHNPHGDANQEHFLLWCMIYGCLGVLDPETGAYRGMVAERWEVIDPTTWRFHLRRDLRRHDDGSPLTARDVVHSIERVRTDPTSAQAFTVDPIAEAVAVDAYTVDIKTKVPTSSLISYVFDRLPITSAALHKAYGNAADREHPYGWGPYKLKRIIYDQEVVIESNPDYVGESPKRPQTVIYRLMRDAEQRVTAFLNGEIDIAINVPPQLVPRVTNPRKGRVAKIDGVEPVFLGMNQAFAPFDNIKLRRAIAHAVDRDAIITGLLRGFATKLDGPVGPGQIGYTPDLQGKIAHDPERARKLLAEANLPPDYTLDLYSPVGRYANDRLATAAIVQMLQKAGMKVRHQTPEWSMLWPEIRTGKTGFYFLGRGGVVDPSEFLHQQFGTGVSPRIRYSNPEMDEVLRKERETFDPTERNRWLKQAFEIVLRDVPSHFLWRYQTVFGIADRVKCDPAINGVFWFPTCRVAD